MLCLSLLRRDEKAPPTNLSSISMACEAEPYKVRTLSHGLLEGLFARSIIDCQWRGFIQQTRDQGWPCRGWSQDSRSTRGGSGSHSKFWQPLRGARTRRGVVMNRKSTRLNSSHTVISYAVFCLK